MKFRDIPQFPKAHYRVDISWDYLERWLENHQDTDLDPEFQRHHVWTKEQQTSYLEYVFSGGEGSRLIYFNHPNYMRRNSGDCDLPDKLVLVDGKQRLEAVRSFLRNETRVFGALHSQFEDKMDMVEHRFSVQIAGLRKYSDVLKWYLSINRGGTIHTDAEIQKVKDILTKIGGVEG